MRETWSSCPGFDSYEISDYGRILSKERVDNLGRKYSAKILRYGIQSTRVSVWLISNDGVKRQYGVGPLVLTTFVGERPDGFVCRHIDGNMLNCNLTNLEWSTQSQNMFDRRIHGTDPMLNKTHCPQGHEYSGENLFINSKGARECRPCSRDNKRKWREKNLV